MTGISPKQCACSAQGFIVDSRQRDGYVYRRYECREQSCKGLRWSTVELRLEGEVTPDQVPQVLAKQYSKQSCESIADKLIALAQEILYEG